MVCTACPHGKLKGNCVECSPCPHGKVKHRCEACKTSRAGQPRSKRIKRAPESSPEIMQELEIKQEPDIKQEPEPFTIHGYFGFDKKEKQRRKHLRSIFMLNTKTLVLLLHARHTSSFDSLTILMKQIHARNGTP